MLKILETVLTLLEYLAVELVGMNVLCYLSLRDIIKLERACGSKKSQQLFLGWIPHYPAVVLHYSKHTNIIALTWFSQRKCRISSLYIREPGYNPGVWIINLLVDYFELQVNSNTSIECCDYLLTCDLGDKVKSIYVEGDQNREFMEQLSACTRNVT